MSMATLWNYFVAPEDRKTLLPFLKEIEPHLPLAQLVVSLLM